MHDDPAHGDSHRHGTHVVPLRLLFGVLGALLALTFVTVAATWVDLGRMNIVLALLIAVIKASLVLLFFMHLLWDRPFHAIVLITSLGLLALFIAGTLTDAFAYLPDQIPGYAPEMQR